MQRCRQPVLRVHPPRSRRPGDPVEFLALACRRKGACHGAQLGWIVQWTARGVQLSVITFVDSRSWIPVKLGLAIEGSIYVVVVRQHLCRFIFDRGCTFWGAGMALPWCHTLMLAKSGHVSDDVPACMFFSEGTALGVFFTCIRRLEVA